jgi:deoxyribonuclease-1-like protein
VTVDGTIKIAAFNVQVFGQSKRSKPQVMDILTRTAREFDVMLVQEIRDASETTAQYYLDAINDMPGPDYSFVSSPRLGRTSSKEAYAYYYNASTVKHISDYVWNDVGDVFEREPYIASFRSGNFDFVLVGIHVKPDEAEAEIGALAQVYASILAGNPDEQDIIIIGDFNADGAYFDEDGASALKAEGFSWTITNDMDTMIKTDWTYDRIVITYATILEYDRAEVFRFDSVFGIVDQELIQDVSDHFPVYAIFRTDLVDDDG